MSIVRSFLLLTLVSVTAAAGLFFLGLKTGYEEFRGGYAVLAADDTIEDRTILALLDGAAENFGGIPVSEAAQWVMLDEFDSLQKIPLSEYSSRVFYFDPRNDGYAEKIKKVFLHDGKRFVYIPLDSNKWNSSLLDKKINYLFEDIPFSVEYYGIGKPIYFFFVIYAIASLCLLAICYVKRKIWCGTLLIIPLLPVFSPLAFFGAPGIACAALLLGLFFMFREPLNDFIILCGMKTQKIKLFYKEILKPYRMNFLFLPLFAAALTVIVVFSQLKLLFLTAFFIAAIFVFFLFSKTIFIMSGGRKRFNPVLIIRNRLPDFSFSVFMMPFAAAVFCAMFFSPFMSGSYVSNGQFDTIINEQDYYAHLIYQASFSTRQLGTSVYDFPDFIYDNDGLPSINKMSDIRELINLDDFPPFPLKNLMDFFNEVNRGGKTSDVESTSGFTEKLSLLILLLFILPCLIIKRKDSYKEKAKFSGNKNNAGIKRFTGFNRNKSNVYKKDELRIRKDA
ncbi:MAG: hypothetical protein FWF68_00360 [Spirochaetes bacterium]|nr:hypothetical protein [Spirochaetota bacterium]